MKRTAEGMVPFLAFLASEEAATISGKLFKLAADGVIGLWSESEVVREINYYYLPVCVVCVTN